MFMLTAGTQMLTIQYGLVTEDRSFELCDKSLSTMRLEKLQEELWMVLPPSHTFFQTYELVHLHYPKHPVSSDLVAIELYFPVKCSTKHYKYNDKL